jgi:hypothetical protein
MPNFFLPPTPLNLITELWWSRLGTLIIHNSTVPDETFLDEEMLEEFLNEHCMYLLMKN